MRSPNLPTDIRGVQQLIGRLAALSRFISRLGERMPPFYQLPRKGDKFEWTEEACKAFADLKKTLSTPPILAVPKEREKLYLYVAARNSVVSTSLVVEHAEEGKVQSIQRPIYYLSMLLTKSQQRYPHYQKLLLAVVMTSRKVSHYFDEHPITVVSSAPLVDILNNPERLGESPSGTSSSAHVTCSSSIQQPSRPKYSQISWSSGRRFRHLAPQTYQTRGQCSLMGP